MQFSTSSNTPTGIQPLDICVTLETADDIRWFYHLMNMQSKEIVAAYASSSIGQFDDRFEDFELPSKKALFKAVKQHAADNNVTL